MKDGTYYIWKENGSVWVDGIKKRKVDERVNKLPTEFRGFVNFDGETVTQIRNDTPTKEGKP